MEYQHPAEVVAKEICACLDMTQGTSPDIHGLYTILKRSYHHALVRQPNPSQADIEKVSKEDAAPYQGEDPSPPGRSVPSREASPHPGRPIPN